MAFIDSCWPELFWFELVLKRDCNAVATVGGGWLSTPCLRLGPDIACRKQRAASSTAKSCYPTVVSRSICRGKHIDLFQASCTKPGIDKSFVEKSRGSPSDAERRRGIRTWK